MSPLLFIPAATFLYLLFDLYTVINSVAALLRSISFWLLWLLFSILNCVALLLFQATALKALLPIVSPTSATFLTVFFTTVLAEANKKKVELAKSNTLRLARKLTAFYEEHPTAIEADYERLMSFGPRAQNQV